MRTGLASAAWARIKIALAFSSLVVGCTPAANGTNPNDASIEDQRRPRDVATDSIIPSDAVESGPLDAALDAGCVSGTLCGATCVDTSTDPGNCGACGHACAAGLVCAAGACGCASGTLCASACVNTGTDAANCGACGTACAAGQVCVAGACARAPHRVTSIAGLLTTLADNTVDEIVVANGTYHVSPSSSQAADSLWIGARFAGRTRPVTVRAETTGGVTFDGGGERVFGGMSFEAGAHDQTWDGFNFANGKPTETGVITFGGYGLAPAHHITIRNLTMMSSITNDTVQLDHFIYFSSDGAHDILIEDYTVNNPARTVRSALQFNHDPNVYNVTVRRMHVTGTQNAILMYAGTTHDVLIEDSDITDASESALNVNATGANVVLRNVTSTNSHGTYYPSGMPAGLSLVNCSFQ